MEGHGQRQQKNEGGGQGVGGGRETAVYRFLIVGGVEKMAPDLHDPVDGKQGQGGHGGQVKLEEYLLLPGEDDPRKARPVSGAPQ